MRFDDDGGQLRRPRGPDPQQRDPRVGAPARRRGHARCSAPACGSSCSPSTTTPLFPRLAAPGRGSRAAQRRRRLPPARGPPPAAADVLAARAPRLGLESPAIAAYSGPGPVNPSTPGTSKPSAVRRRVDSTSPGSWATWSCENRSGVSAGGRVSLVAAGCRRSARRRAVIPEAVGRRRTSPRSGQ